MANISPSTPFVAPDEIIRDKFFSEHLQIQIFLFVTFVIFISTLFFGRLRSRGGSYMKITSTTFFIIANSLTSFVFGLMNTPGLFNDLYVIWLGFMAYLATVANQSNCYTLDDNEGRKRTLFIDHLVFFIFIYILVLKTLSAPLEVTVPICLLFWVIILKIRERNHALTYATYSYQGISKATKIISYFNRYRKEGGKLSSSSNPSYNSLLVGVKEAKALFAKQSKIRLMELINFDLSSVITLDTVFDENNTFLKTTKEGMELRDTCISFSMFWGLLGKTAGFKNLDVKLFKSKLTPNSFDLVEKELGFLYEYLFTNNYAIYERGLWKKIRDICIMLLLFIVSLPLLLRYQPDERNMVYVSLRGRVLDTGFTRFVIVAIVIIELTQICIFLTSKWAKVMYTCAYLQNPTQRNFLLEWTIRVIYHAPRPKLKKFTKRKLGQYSILKSHNAIPALKWGDCLIGSYIDLAGIGHGGSSHEDLSPVLKASIVNVINNVIEDNGGKVTNGVRFLKKNELEDEIINPFVTKVSSQARVVLIWHLVTSYLENKEKSNKTATKEKTSCFKKKKEETSTKDPYFLTATIFSKYCAYLIAFIPQILSNNAYKTQCEFDEAVRELQGLFSEENEDDENPKWGLMGENSILEEAQQLWEKLVTKENLWKILAEFWTEILLFTALADHKEAFVAHEDSLCVGGEFITHVWALATHAGCTQAPIIYI